MRCYLFWIEVAVPVGGQMPRVKLTKSAIDALPIPPKDVVYWDANCPGFGVKVEGLTEAPGIYFAGVDFSSTRKSGTINAIAE